jgi:hypothetical protein
MLASIEEGRSSFFSRSMFPATEDREGWTLLAVETRETERGSPCRPIETEVNRDSGSTYDRVSFLGYLPKTGVVTGSLHTRLII